MSASAQSRGGRIDWRRARLLRRRGALSVELLPQQGSAMLSTLSRADALAAIGPATAYAAGESVDVLLLDALD